jgi:hypothetical protein
MFRSVLHILKSSPKSSIAYCEGFLCKVGRCRCTQIATLHQKNVQLFVGHCGYYGCEVGKQHTKSAMIFF